jgi:hypothetical protein
MTQLALHDRLLHFYMRRALESQKDRGTALRIARLLEAGEYRVVGVFRADHLERLDPDSMAYRVDVRCLDGWAELCTIHWTLLGLEWADVMLEVENVQRQHAEGTYPGGPRDPRDERV